MLTKLGPAVILWLASLAIQLPAEQPTINLNARFAPLPIFPSLVIAARTNQVPLDGIDVPNAKTNLSPGDTLTALITLYEKDNKRTQWLLYLQAVTPTTKEQATKPPAPMTLTGRKGTKFTFAPSPTWVSLRTLGPFIGNELKRKPPKALDKQERFALNEGFLRLGFDRAAKIVQWAEAMKEGGTNNIPAEIKGAKNADEVMEKLISPEDERALMGSGAAMMSFYEIVQHTSGLEDILYDLVDKPSVWSMVKNLGVTADVKFPSDRIIDVNPATWKVPATNAAYTFPLELALNRQPALRVTFVVTVPQPPLLSSAGIISMLAERPGDKEHYMTLRILSARNAKATP